MSNKIAFKPQHDVRTRIIWSFGDDALNEQLAVSVAGSHFDALRLVYFQGMQNSIIKFIQALRRREEKHNAPIMIDIALKIRATVAGLDKPRRLEVGEKISIVPHNRGKHNDLVIKTDEWEKLFAAEATIYVGTGNVMLKCLTVQAKTVTAEVIQGETIYPHAPIKIPATNKQLRASDLIIADIEQFLDQSIDFIVIPGLTELEEIKKFRTFINDKTSNPPWLILKIDTLKVYQELTHLIAAVDGVLISRREIALTTNPATVPMLAKEITQLCSHHSKLIITASEILGSMRYNPAPNTGGGFRHRQHSYRRH